MWNRFPSKPLCDQIQMRRPCGKYCTNMDMWEVPIVAHRYEMGALQALAATIQCFWERQNDWDFYLATKSFWRFQNVLKILLVGNFPDSPRLLLACGRQIFTKLRRKPRPFRALGLIQPFPRISRLMYAFLILIWFCDHSIFTISVFS